MIEKEWALSEEVDAIVFDFDGTLVAMEGIDELARLVGVYDQVHSLTKEAMEATGLSEDLYQQRLALIHPLKTHMVQLGELYSQRFVSGAQEVIGCFQSLSKKIYVVSSGLREPILHACRALNVPESHIYAVNINFDSMGHYQDFDHKSPLIQPLGKKAIVHELIKSHKRIVFVGDGMNDIVVVGEVTRFIGYGGVSFRKSIQELSPYYVRSSSLVPVIPLSLTTSEYDLLSCVHQELYKKGVESIYQGLVDRVP